jgi:hypothetical protein
MNPGLAAGAAAGIVPRSNGSERDNLENHRTLNDLAAEVNLPFTIPRRRSSWESGTIPVTRIS